MSRVGVVEGTLRIFNFENSFLIYCLGFKIC